MLSPTIKVSQQAVKPSRRSVFSENSASESEENDEQICNLAFGAWFIIHHNLFVDEIRAWRLVDGWFAYHWSWVITPRSCSIGRLCFILIIIEASYHSTGAASAIGAPGICVLRSVGRQNRMTFLRSVAKGYGHFGQIW